MVFLLMQNSPSTLDERFLRLEDQLLVGMREKDGGRLESLLANDYVLRGRPDIDRTTWIRNAVSLCWGETAEVDEFRAREEAGAVVTSFVLTMHQDPTTCKPATIRSLITDVWRQENEAWQLAVRHSGPVGSEGADAIAQQFLQEEAPPPRWDASSELSFVSTGGNADVQTLGVGLKFVHRAGSWETAGNSSFVRSIAEGLENARSFTASIRQAATLNSRLDLFGRTSYSRDLFAGVEHRGTADAGLGVRVIRSGPHRLKTDIGLGYLREERLVGPSLSSAIINSVQNWNWQAGESFSIGNEASWTMPLEDTQAWRVNNQFSITTTLTDMFAVKVSYSTNFLNTPVPGFGRVDTIASAALVTRFQHR